MCRPKGCRTVDGISYPMGLKGWPLERCKYKDSKYANLNCKDCACVLEDKHVWHPIIEHREKTKKITGSKLMWACARCGVIGWVKETCKKYSELSNEQIEEAEKLFFKRQIERWNRTEGKSNFREEVIEHYEKMKVWYNKRVRQ